MRSVLRRAVARHALILFSLLLPAAVASAQAAGGGQWQPVRGLEGGWIHSLGAAGLTPGALYGESEDGVLWRSRDGGRSWALAGPTPNRTTAPVTVDPSNPDTLYLLDQQDSLWKSADGGASWSNIGLGMDIKELAISSSSPQTLFALESAAAPANAVLLRSDDGGASWRPLPQGPFQPPVIGGLAVDPTTPEVVYASDDFHLYKSLDGGSHWSQVPADGSGFGGLSWVSIDPHNHQVLYAFAGVERNLVTSSDGGASWTSANHGIEGAFIERMVIAPSGNLYIVAQAVVYASTDHGAHWMQVGKLGNPPYVQGFAVDAGSPDLLYSSLFATDGISISIDGGHTWTTSDAGLTAVSPRQLAVNRNRPDKVYAMVGSSRDDSTGRFRRSDDGGASWSLLAPTGTQDARITLDAHAGILYAVGASQFLLRSDDDGASWHPPGASSRDFILALAAEPRASGALWELGLPAGGLPDLRHSTDGGASWSVLAEIDDPPAGPPPSRGGIFIAPVRPATIYVLLPSGRLFETTDGGATLASIQPPAPVIDLAVDPTRRGRGRLYAATTRRQSIWRSLDRGATWQQASRGLPPRTAVVALAVDPITPSTVYAATNRGVWVSDDGAQSWQPLGAGLPDLPLLSLAVVPGTPGTILVGTQGAGAYSLTR